MRNGDIIRNVKNAARNKYAWPGGYPIIIVMSDGETLCADCARTEFGRIGRATRDSDPHGWAANSTAIHWEGPPEVCCNCNAEIPSAYGE